MSLTAYCLSLLEKDMEQLKGVQAAGALLPMASVPPFCLLLRMMMLLGETLLRLSHNQKFSHPSLMGWLEWCFHSPNHSWDNHKHCVCTAGRAIMAQQQGLLVTCCQIHRSSISCDCSLMSCTCTSHQGADYSTTLALAMLREIYACCRR